MSKDVFQPGDVVDGRYRIRRFLGRGGTGEVYEAETLGETSSPVAVKTLLPRFFDSIKAITRFERECEYSQRIDHPNVLRVLEVFHIPLPRSVAKDLPESLEGGTMPCMVMELLRGETLADQMERGKIFSTEEAHPLACQVASALAAAHRAGVVHRDLKPDNIFIEPREGGPPRVVLTDFGVARSSLTSGEEALTASNVLPGTPSYMAPEQLELEQAIPASDIYTLGLVLFEMVTGRAPFEAPTPIQMVFLRVDHDAPSPRKFVPDLDVAWEEVILRCLERDPQKRYATADEIIQRLDGADSTWLDQGRGRTLWPWILGAAVLLLVIAVVVLTLR
jgi:serine/threonine protein kinase